MGQLGTTLAQAATLGYRYAHRLTKDVPDDQFARLVHINGQAIQSNHPAFVIGHLILYPAKILQFLGEDFSGIEPPANYATIFSKEAKCVDDPDGTIYPGKEELLQWFTRSYDAAFAALRSASDEKLLTENPVESPTKPFVPTLGALVGFYVGGHVMGHCGQISAWRRFQGLPPA